MDHIVDILAVELKKPIDHVRFLVCIILQIPIGLVIFLFTKMLGPTMKHLVQIVAGITLQIYMFRDDWIHIFIMGYSSYFIMMFWPRKSQHKAVMAWLLAYLSCQFVHSMIYDYGGFKMDSIRITKLIFTKVWALSWAYRDGLHSVDDLSKDQAERR